MDRDFTYIRTAKGWLYVSAVIDLFPRRVVGWSMSASKTAQLVADALLMAIRRRGKPDALTHHSDQGSQYVSEQFQRLMADSGIVCSMRADQAMSGTMRRCRFYNPTRRHSTIGYGSPVEFERKLRLA